MRILLWLLVVMTIALGAVAVTVRSILHRDVEHRISQSLSQETGEFVNFVAQGVDPDTGRGFGDPRRLLQTFLQRQYADPDEELLGLPRSSTNGSDVIRQRRDFPDHTALWRDEKALSRIVAAKDSSGTLHRSQGELRWAKVSSRPLGDEPRGAFVVAFHADRERDSGLPGRTAMIAVCEHLSPKAEAPPGRSPRSRRRTSARTTSWWRWPPPA